MRVAAALRNGEHDRSVGQRVRPPMLELIVCRVQLGQPFAVPPLERHSHESRIERRKDDAAVVASMFPRQTPLGASTTRVRASTAGDRRCARSRRERNTRPTSRLARRTVSLRRRYLAVPDRRATSCGKRSNEQTPAAIRRALCRIHEPLAIRRHRERAENAICRQWAPMKRTAGGGGGACVAGSRRCSKATQGSHCPAVSLAARTHVAQMDYRGGGRALCARRVVARSTYGFSNCNRDAADRR